MEYYHVKQGLHCWCEEILAVIEVPKGVRIGQEGCLSWCWLPPSFLEVLSHLEDPAPIRIVFPENTHVEKLNLRHQSME